MTKFKNTLLALITATVAFTAGAESVYTPVYTPAYTSEFAPIKEGLNDFKMRNEIERFPCSTSACQTASMTLDQNIRGMLTGSRQGTILKIPKKLSDYTSITVGPLQSFDITSIMTLGELEFFLQTLTYATFVPGYTLTYDEALQARTALELLSKKLDAYNEQMIKSKGIETTPNALTTQVSLSIYQSMKNNANRRMAVINFMLSSPEAFNNYKNAFNKFYTVNLPFQKTDFQPHLKSGVLRGAKLTAYECQFINAVDDFKKLQAENGFSCPNQ